MPSEKDADLLAALLLIDERLRELPEELDEPGLPRPGMELLGQLVGRGMALRVARAETAVGDLPLPITAEVEMGLESPDAAARWIAELASLMAGLGAPLGAATSGAGFAVPGEVPLWIGATDSVLHLRVGSQEGVAPGDPVTILEAYDPYLSARVAHRELLWLLGESGDEPLSRAGLEAILGFYGLPGDEVELAIGADSERSLLRITAPGARPEGTRSTLGPEVLLAVPEDATWASAEVVDLPELVRRYEEALRAFEEPDLDLRVIIAEELGMDLDTELLAAFGRRWVGYGADSTGGSGLMSTVLVGELGNRSTFLELWSRFIEELQLETDEDLDGRLTLRGFQRGGVDYQVVALAGLPLPLEVTVAVLETQVVVGASPNACIAGVEQLRDGRRSLLDRPDFVQQLPDSMEGATRLVWLDSPRLARDGYGLLSMGASALTNLVRSVDDRRPDPGVLLPTFRELVSGARPMVSVTRVVGPDLVVETRADRSHLVNAAGLLGALQTTVLDALGGGLMLGALLDEGTSMDLELEEARVEGALLERLEAVKAELEAYEVQEEMELELYARMERIHTALERFAQLNGGRYPDSLATLARPDGAGQRFLDPADLRDPWGDAYLYEPPASPGESPLVDFQE